MASHVHFSRFKIGFVDEQVFGKAALPSGIPSQVNTIFGSFGSEEQSSGFGQRHLLVSSTDMQLPS